MATPRVAATAVARAESFMVLLFLDIGAKVVVLIIIEAVMILPFSLSFLVSPWFLRKKHMKLVKK